MTQSASAPPADTVARIARIRLHPLLYRMPDSHAYGMARGLTAARGATLVEIETSTGVTGWGEAWGPPDFPAAYLGMVEARWRGARFPVLCANVVTDAGKPLLPGSVVLDADGVPVGFIGAVVSSTPSLVRPDAVKGLRFLDEAARRLARDAGGG